MKRKNKFVLGGFVLVVMAAIALLTTFGIVGREKGHRTTTRTTTTQGGKVIEEKTSYEGGYTQSVRQIKSPHDRITDLGINLRLAMSDLMLILNDKYFSLARCIKKGLDRAGIRTTGIVVIPDLCYGNVHTYYNTGDIVTGGLLEQSDAGGGLILESYTYFVGMRPDNPTVIGVIGYSWSARCSYSESRTGSFETRTIYGETEGVSCSLDTETIRNAVQSCLEKDHSLLDNEYGRVFIATRDGWVVINANGEVVACYNWET